MKCPVCHQHCGSTLAKQYAKEYLTSKVPRHVRLWRRLKRTLSPLGWPPTGWER